MQPARSLSPRQQRFVQEFATNGGSQRHAAIVAGYAPTAADDTATRLVRNPLIQQAILKELAGVIGLSAVPALATVRKLAIQARSEYVMLEASKDLLDRAGFSRQISDTHRGDQNLNVSINLAVEGASKTQLNSDSDHPDMRKTALEFDHQPEARGAGATRPEGDDASHGIRTRARESCKEAVVWEGEYVDLSEIPHFLGRKIDSDG